MKSIKAFLVILVCIGLIMVALGIKVGMAPPILTGVGFFVIAYLFQQTKKDQP
ncbi:MAG: hypothetical protein KC469_06455 [Flavobacteriaceae bacterium]|nr:hypothetical protein [Flavobacteriaceae bacterium]